MLTRREYLEAMGIDVWTRRTGQLTRPTALSKAALPEEILPKEVKEKAGAMVGAEGARQAMRRNQSVTSPATNADERKTVSVLPVAETGKQAPPNTAAPVPEFRFALLHYGLIGMCVALEKRAQLPRRFCDDIALALGIPLVDTKYQLLNWPMLESASFDQSRESAMSVVGQKFEMLPRTIIVFGQDVALYHPPLVSIRPPATLETNGQRLVFFPAVAEVMQSAELQRNLWATLVGLSGHLRQPE